MAMEIPHYLDPNNPLLATGPAQLDTGIIEAPDTGRLGVLTVRTNSTTVSVMMNGADLETWIGVLENLKREMDGKKVIAATPEVAAKLQGLKPRNG